MTKRQLSKKFLNVPYIDGDYEVTNALRRAGIHTIGQALTLSKDQLMKIDGVGVTIANEITNALKYYRDSDDDHERTN